MSHPESSPSIQKITGRENARCLIDNLYPLDPQVVGKLVASWELPASSLAAEAMLSHLTDETRDIAQARGLNQASGIEPAEQVPYRLAAIRQLEQRFPEGDRLLSLTQELATLLIAELKEYIIREEDPSAKDYVKRLLLQDRLVKDLAKFLGDFMYLDNDLTPPASL
jgi:hypothetical protein